MSSKTKVKGSSLEKRRKLVESTATFGLLLICVALVSSIHESGMKLIILEISSGFSAPGL